MPPPPLTPRARATLVAVAVLYAAVAIAIGIHKGNSLEPHLLLAQHLLARSRVYDRPPLFGTWWPPAALLLLTPFAAVAWGSMAWAKGLFAALRLACLFWCIARAPAARWSTVVIAAAAIAGALQRDAETLNLNVILLALVVAGASDLRAGKDVRAGAWFGVATALKAFPALLLAYLVLRRRWRAAAIGAGTAAALTAAPLAWLGIAGARQTVADWMTLSASGSAAVRGVSDSLTGVLDRGGASPAIELVIVVLLLGAVAWALRRPGDEVADVGAVSLAATLVAPVVWLQSFALAYPAWLGLVDGPAFAAPRRRLWGGLAAIVVAVTGIAASWGRGGGFVSSGAVAYSWEMVIGLAWLLVTRLDSSP